MVRRWLCLFAVLRPSFVFGLIIAYLPLTSISWMPGSRMFGNLFVDYQIAQGFWFGLALYGAVWATMLTACIMLDGERDLEDRWMENLPKNQRRATIPMKHPSTFIWFSTLGIPGIVMVVWKAVDTIWCLIGLVVGIALAYLCMDFVIYLIARHASIRTGRPYQILPWPPLRLWKLLPEFLFRWLETIVEWVDRVSARIAKGIGVVPQEFFRANARQTDPHLVDDQLFAVASLIGVSLLYLSLSFILNPEWWHSGDWLPTAGFIYALFLPLIWLISAIWFHLRRYRLVLFVVILFPMITSLPFFVDPSHTYDISSVRDPMPLMPLDVAAPPQKSARPERKNLIVVSASGGGILAAAWTTKVLTALHSAYPEFRDELRLLSTVSGGSVGAAYYATAHCGASPQGPLPRAVLEGALSNSMESSLADAAYGFAFPDFIRIFLPILPGRDRGRLLQDRWRDIAWSGRTVACSDRLSDWKPDILKGIRPGVVFNSTVLETGERIAITPISTLRTKWQGNTSHSKLHQNRLYYARTLSSFLNNTDRDDADNVAGDLYTVDVWTAARLSATFPYLSPAARATSNDKLTKDISRLHLVDGGYSDNYGVASALDWLAAVKENVEGCGKLPFDRIALVEIRLREDNPLNRPPYGAWRAEWAGPLLGLMHSWDFSQVARNDTELNRMLDSFKRYMMAECSIRLESFVFVMTTEGPLSWRLSEEQKQDVDKAWLAEGENQRGVRVCLDFLRYVKRIDANDKEVTESLGGPCTEVPRYKRKE